MPERNNIIAEIIKRILNHSLKVLVFYGLLTVLMLYPALNSSADNSLSIWYNNSSDVYKNYIDFKDHFGSDENLVVIYKNENLFSEEQLALNKELTTALENLEGVQSVTSLSNIRVPIIRGLKLYTAPIIPTKTSDYERLKNRIRNNPIFAHNIISQDGEATGILVYFKDTTQEHRTEIFQKIKTTVQSEKYSSNNYYFAGNIAIVTENNRISNSESARFLTYCIILIFLLFLIYYRSLYLALIPIIVAFCNVVFTIGIFSLAGKSMNMVVVIIPLIVFVISVALSVHVISRTQNFIVVDTTIHTALISSTNSVIRPCFYSTLTTASAFLAFTFSNIDPVSVFGLFTAIGVFLSFFVTFSLLPCLLKYSNKATSAKIKIIRWDAFSHSLARFTYNNRFWILLASFLLLAFSMVGISKLSFETDQIKYFSKTNKVRQSNDTAQVWFEGIYPIEVLFTLEEDIYENWKDYYKLFYELERELNNIPEVVALHSPLVFFQSLFHSDTIEQENIFKTTIPSRYLSEVKKNQFLNRYLTADGKSFHISIKTEWMNNESAREIIDKIEIIIASNIGQNNISYNITGIVTMYLHLNQMLATNQINSFIISFSLILLILLILFRNVFLALVGMIPNVLPVVCTLGLLGWFKIPLDVATILIAAISLGIAVDDTIHFLSIYKQSKVKGNITRIEHTYKLIGRPITFTSILLISGFVVMIFSEYLPLTYFGFFAALIILFALLYDLLLLPSIVFITFRKRN